MDGSSAAFKALRTAMYAPPQPAGALDVGVLINNVGMSYPFTKFYHELTDEEARPAANAPPPRVRARARALTLSRAPAAGGGPRRDQRELDDVDDEERQEQQPLHRVHERPFCVESV